jgi:hypothetical protein
MRELKVADSVVPRRNRVNCSGALMGSQKQTRVTI